jgi:hypothetical protein
MTEKQSPPAKRIQHWYRCLLNYRFIKKQFKENISQENLQQLLSTLNEFTNKTSSVPFEACQARLFNEQFFNKFSNILESVFYKSMYFLPLMQINEFHNQNPHEGQAPNYLRPSMLPLNATMNNKSQQVMQKSFVKTVLSAYLITNYPQDILGSSQENQQESSNSEIPVNFSELKQKSEKCLHWSKLVLKNFWKLMSFISDRWYSPSSVCLTAELKEFHTFFYNNLFTMQYYLLAFHDWKRIDSLLVIHSLEETLQQSYYTYLLAKYEEQQTPQSPQRHILESCQHQISKIQDMLKRILGPKKSISRFEEIKAGVEASNPTLAPAKRHRSNSSDAVAAAGEKSIGNPVKADETVSAKINNDIKSEVLQIPSRSLSLHPSPSASNKNEPSQQHTPDQAKTMAAKHLELLSRLAGIENERIAYEITLNKHYRLPAKRQSLYNELMNAHDPLGEENGKRFEICLIDFSFIFYFHCREAQEHCRGLERSHSIEYRR